MTKETTNTYTATSPDGEKIVTRNTKHVYEYAVFAKSVGGNGRYYLAGFSKSKANAEKLATKTRNDHELSGWEHKYTNTEIADSKANRKRNYDVTVVPVSEAAE